MEWRLQTRQVESAKSELNQVDVCVRFSLYFLEYIVIVTNTKYVYSRLRVFIM